MRILIHDFPGHPFQAELARSLGAQGHEVLHVQCESFTSGKGNMADDPGSSTRFVAVSLGETVEKYHLVRRLRQELRYSAKVLGIARRYRPDVVVASNDPLISKTALAVWSVFSRVPWIFWLQDIWSLAMAREAAQRSKLGRVVGRGFQWLERQLLRRADAVVQITPDFDSVLDHWSVPKERRTVIENWAPLGEIQPTERTNGWAVTYGLAETFTYLYAGTLGLKHNPDALYELALAEPDAAVVVISEGLGAERLRRLSDERPAPNLQILPFQPWEVISEVLATADVLLVLLEEEAGTFSAPSKILTSLCAGRAILAAMPLSNLGARTIERAGAGIVVRNGDLHAYLAAARQLREDPEQRLAMAASGRRYAEEHFDIDAITARFTAVIDAVVA